MELEQRTGTPQRAPGCRGLRSLFDGPALAGPAFRKDAVRQRPAGGGFRRSLLPLLRRDARRKLGGPRRPERAAVSLALRALRAVRKVFGARAALPFGRTLELQQHSFVPVVLEHVGDHDAIDARSVRRILRVEDDPSLDEQRGWNSEGTSEQVVVREEANPLGGLDGLLPRVTRERAERANRDQPPGLLHAIAAEMGRSEPRECDDAEGELAVRRADLVPLNRRVVPGPNVLPPRKQHPVVDFATEVEVNALDANPVSRLVLERDLERSEVGARQRGELLPAHAQARGRDFALREPAVLVDGDGRLRARNRCTPANRPSTPKKRSRHARYHRRHGVSLLRLVLATSSSTARAERLTRRIRARFRPTVNARYRTRE